MAKAEKIKALQKQLKEANTTIRDLKSAMITLRGSGKPIEFDLLAAYDAMIAANAVLKAENTMLRMTLRDITDRLAMTALLLAGKQKSRDGNHEHTRRDDRPERTQPDE